MKVEAKMPATLQDVDGKQSQHQAVQPLRLNKGGRRLMLAYVGLWGCAYDRATGVYRSAIKLWDDAVARGEMMEQELRQRLAQLEHRATKQLNGLQNRFGDNVEQVTRTVTDTGESLEVQMEKQIERVLVNLGIPTRERLERLNQEIDRLNARLDEELARQGVVHA
jgi:poly(hydroxyalkanoate) granule-associated protein